jgi:hypothetical protein
MTRGTLFVLALAASACSGGGKPAGKMDSMMMSGNAMPVDEFSQFGELEVGADWKTYTKMNKASFKSETHGGRLVDTYVNSVGLDAFKKGEAMPVGSIVVKTSKDADDGSEGPIFVMEKRAKQWWYAIHWANPPEAWKKKLGGSIYWRTPSKKADYCFDCHDNYNEAIGGVPEDQRAW